MLKNKIAIYIILSLWIGNYHCTSLLISEVEQSKVTIQYLRDKGYRLRNISSSEKDAIPNQLALTHSVYQGGDFIKICSLRQIKNIDFERSELPIFTAMEIDACSQMELEWLGIFKVKIGKEALCKITNTFRNSLLKFDVSESGLSDEMMPCISRLQKLDFLLIGRGSNINKDSFCKTLLSLPNLHFIRIEDTDLPKSALQCILDHPNLTEIWLRSWKNANYDDKDALIKAYERKYQRKIKFNLYD